MFRTELSLRPDAQLLSVGARVLTIGSCFADVIGERLGQHKVRSLVNPFGTVFNPLAAARLLRAVAGEETDWQQHLVEARGRWQSYDLHATVGADSPPALLQRIEQVVRDTTEFVRSADVLVWTLGTAFGYRLRDTGEVVNNCHKLPQERFEKELLTAEEIVSAVTEAYALLRQINPKLRLILTVSPVRHLRDTLPLNAVSKSVLRVACHYLSELLPGASYFPAYELLLDDLRDYRFYAADMIHPSDVAEQYVWDKFTSTYFSADFRQFAQEWEGIRRSLAHKPLHEGAPEHRQFLEQTQQRLERLAGRADVRSELREVHRRIVALPPPPKPVIIDEVEDDEERIDVGFDEEQPRERPVATNRSALPAPQMPASPPPPAPIAEPASDLEKDFEDEETGVDEADVPESEAMEDAGLPKRRKRKRGGRKHKRKGNRPAEDVPAADAPGSADADTTLPEIQPEATTLESVSPGENIGASEPVTSTSDVDQTESDEPRSAGKKRRSRPKRKQTRLYADQSTDDVPKAQTAAESTEPVAEILEPTAANPSSASSDAPAVTEDSSADATAKTEPSAAASAAEEASAPKVPARRNGRGKRGGSKIAPAITAAAEALPSANLSVAVLDVMELAAPIPTPEPTVEALDNPAEVAPSLDASAMGATETGSLEADTSVTNAPAASKRRAAPKRKPAAKAPAVKAKKTAVNLPPSAQDAPAEAAPENPTAAPKRRGRPPRRKPDDSTANS